MQNKISNDFPTVDGAKRREGWSRPVIERISASSAAMPGTPGITEGGSGKS